jgi:hypothetical protein
MCQADAVNLNIYIGAGVLVCVQCLGDAFVTLWPGGMLLAFWMRLFSSCYWLCAWAIAALLEEGVCDYRKCNSFARSSSAE